ncbi:MAG: hypothetical protein F6J89_08120, partial [Symploca sp. SIO1C4]|nr:hypothetical protein [Symploca sp. SIO1C4]
MGRGGDGERGRYGEGETRRGGDTEMGRWGDTERGRWGDTEIEIMLLGNNINFLNTSFPGELAALGAAGLWAVATVVYG